MYAFIPKHQHVVGMTTFSKIRKKFAFGTKLKKKKKRVCASAKRQIGHRAKYFSSQARYGRTVSSKRQKFDTAVVSVGGGGRRHREEGGGRIYMCKQDIRKAAQFIRTVSFMVESEDGVGSDA